MLTFFFNNNFILIENCYRYDCNHFLDDTPILKKSPNSSELIPLIKCHSSRWDEFASVLQVPLDKRESLRRDSTLENGGRLKRVVVIWIESQCSPVTWKNIVHTLVSMDLKTTADKVQDYLKQQQVICKSRSKQLCTTSLYSTEAFIHWINLDPVPNSKII